MADLQIEVGGFRFTARYEDGAAPATVAAFREHVLAGALHGNWFATIVDGLDQLPALDHKLQWEGAQSITFAEL